jgi:hypothetical protein
MMVMLTTFITPPLLRRLLVQGTPTKLKGSAAELVTEAPMDSERE